MRINTKYTFISDIYLYERFICMKWKESININSDEYRVQSTPQPSVREFR